MLSKVYLGNTCMRFKPHYIILMSVKYSGKTSIYVLHFQYISKANKRARSGTNDQLGKSTTLVYLITLNIHSTH